MKIVLLAFAAVQLAGCGCTDIGCAPSVEIRVVSQAERISQLELVEDGTSTVRCTLGVSSQRCQSTRESDGSLKFVLFDEPKGVASVRFLDAENALVSEAQLTVDIRNETPNGEDCAPVCRVGTATF